MNEEKNLNEEILEEQVENPYSVNHAKEALEKEKKKKSEAFDWLQCIVTALVVCVLIFVFAFRVVGVVGGSMEDTLIEGDKLIITKLFYDEPQYGDIVVLRKETFGSQPIIKRVIATEGQVVEIDFDEGIVYVDGVALDEPYTKTPTNSRQDFIRRVEVPEGCVFVMGDNRNRSTDSRTDTIGCVDTRYILGKAILRLYPFSKFGAIE